MIPPVGDKEVMGLRPAAGKVMLQGSSTVALASAFNWYLNDFLNTTYDWSTYEVFIPSSPPMPATVNRTRVVQNSYYLNVCTYGYSLAFSDWAYWQKHIDWMAMQGVNMPLAFLGQEQVMLNLFARFNITFEEMQEFISGPAFLPWFRMGNLQAWGGPITRTWITKRVTLQQQVLARMRSMGMRPALPCFSGFIPPAFVTKHPTVNYTQAADWNRFPGKYGRVDLLEPTDEMFQQVGKAWVEEQTKLFGTDHIYQCDTYNEMSPRSGDLNYLANSSSSVHKAMKAADPDAIWLMQGWLFYYTPSGFWTTERIKAYLDAVPDSGMWILDLAAAAHTVWTKTSSFFGKPFVWNTLHGYGGQQGLTGNLPQIDAGFDAAASNSTVMGVGITMEGIWQNYIVYEYTLAKAWGRAGDPQTYARQFGARRWGSAAAPAAARIWGDIYTAAYATGGKPDAGPITKRPTFSALALAAPRRNCTWTSEISGTYLANYPAGFDPTALPYANTLAAAQEWCEGAGDCGGVTLSQQRYEARAGPVPAKSPAQEASWVKLCASASPLAKIWGDMLQLSGTAGAVKAYRFDVVDVGREFLTQEFARRQLALALAAGAKNVSATQQAAARLLSVIDDFDALLSTDSNFMFGSWRSQARSWGSSTQESDWLEFNARNQVTLWGPNGEIVDYSTKAWGGLARSFFKPRWALLTKQVVEAVQQGKQFDQQAFDKEVLQSVEQPWQNCTDAYPDTPEADTIKVATALYAKYVAAETVLV